MQNYFTLLELPESFDIDETALQRAYISAQQASHPDCLVGKNDSERTAAIQISMDVNEAYEALKNPLLRAQHMLALKGLTVNVDGADSVKASQALLMETMELREQLEASDSAADLMHLAADIKSAASKCKETLAKQLAAAQYDAAAQEVIRLRYLGKSMEEAQMRQFALQAGANAS